MRASWKFVTLSLMAVVATAALMVAGAATAASVTPTEVTGNFTGDGGGNNYGCSDYVSGNFVFNGTSAPVADGQVVYTGTTSGGSSYSLTVTQTGGNSIDFSITGGTVLVAAVKGSNSFNLYNYQPGGTTADTSLIPPNFPGQMSHYVFCIGDPIVTAVAFRSASAVRTHHAVVVRWKTASEADTIGYNVYRLMKGKLVRANKHLILVHGGSYSFTDSKAPSARSLRYRIAAVHTDGSRNWFGPLAVRAAA
jgi:hypothetical protein